MTNAQKLSLEEFHELKRILFPNQKIDLVVSTDSMHPLLPVGASIQVGPIEKKPRPFDIVVFWDEGALKCQYVARENGRRRLKNSESIITRPLSGKHDAIVPVQMVLGRVMSHKIPLTKKLVLFARQILKRGDTE